jgi:hypothetical protein
VGQDGDNDGIYEQWNITMRIKKPKAHYKLVHASFLAAFDYQTSSNVHMQMETICAANLDIPQRMSSKVSA